MASMKDKLKKIAHPTEVVHLSEEPLPEGTVEIKVPTKKTRPKKTDKTFGEKLIQSAEEAAEIVKKPRKKAAPKKVEPPKQARRVLPHVARPLLEGVSMLAVHLHTTQQTQNQPVEA